MARHALVEIVSQEETFVSMDFGDFAWLILQEESGARGLVFRGDRYCKIFRYLEEVDHAVCDHRVEHISMADFWEAEAITRHCNDIVKRRFERFVARVFPQYAHYIKQ